MMLVPKAEEQAQKVLALAPRWPRRRRRLGPDRLRLRHADKLQYVVNKAWIEVTARGSIVGLDGSRCRSCPHLLITRLVIIYS